MSPCLIWAYYANIMLLVSKLVTKFKLQRPRSHIMKKIQQIFFLQRVIQNFVNKVHKITKWENNGTTKFNITN